jgi:hypothetical protein
VAILLNVWGYQVGSKLIAPPRRQGQKKTAYAIAQP